MYYNDYAIYSLEWIDFVLKDDYKEINQKNKPSYLNVSCSFDIETTSFYTDLKTESKAKLEIDPSEEKLYRKSTTMYGFCFGINGKAILARTWSDFLYICKKIKERYQLDSNKRIICYVHNLAFEFEFIKDKFKWGEKFFALEERKPLQILAEEYGIEFRDSLALTGYSLAKVGEHLHKYKVNKLVGDLDYSLFRHSKTPLTYLEQSYMRNDVLVVMAHIQEEIERLGNITKIPLTKTGYVRRYVKDCCLYGVKNHRAKESYLKYNSYHKLMTSLQITSVQEYEQLKRAFQGGYTHASGIYANELMRDVYSDDFTSSYPGVMLMEAFPCQNGVLRKIKDKEEFEFYLNRYCCIFDVEFFDLDETFFYDHYISRSKCWNVEEATEDNGRIVKAKKLCTTITEIDFGIIKRTYKWKHMIIKNFRTYMKNYLPTDFVKAIVNLYKDKTTLKGVEGKEVEYLWSKEQLNACYGMSVTDIARDDVIYDEPTKEWKLVHKDVGDQIKKYNTSRTRFLCYQWGVWVTAYARRNLWTGILELKEDYIYTDTDSLKYTNKEKHLIYFHHYNELVEKKLRKAMNYHKIPFEDVRPKTIQGEKKLIGVWDDDGHYKYFKTLGAKRYMIEKDDGKQSLTISGVNKKVAIPYLQNIAKKEKKKTIFDLFTNEMYIDKEGTGKNLHTYIDYDMQGILTDYKGVPCYYHEDSGIHLEKTSYSLSLADQYLDYLNAIKHGGFKDDD